MIATLLLLQAAVTAEPQAPPDIELQANVRARSVSIEQKGEAKLTISTSPDGGNVVDVRAPRANGQRELRDVNVSVRAEARIGVPVAPREKNGEQADTARPESR